MTAGFEYLPNQKVLIITAFFRGNGNPFAGAEHYSALSRKGARGQSGGMAGLLGSSRPFQVLDLET
jgi:hypothetical protein